MLESVVDLLFGLFLSALILLVGTCILSLIVAALRAVNRESDYQGEDVKQVFGVVAEVIVSEDWYSDSAWPCASLARNVHSTTTAEKSSMALSATSKPNKITRSKVETAAAIWTPEFSCNANDKLFARGARSRVSAFTIFVRQSPTT